MVCIVYDVTFEDALDRVSVLIIAALLDGSRLIDSVYRNMFVAKVCICHFGMRDLALIPM